MEVDSRGTRVVALVVVVALATFGLSGCLTAPGSLAGTVRDVSGEALSDIEVTLFDGDDVVATTVTDASGAYRIDDVGPGYDFAVRLHDGTGAHFDWWNAGGSGWSLATRISIGDGATTVIDATMIDAATAASISGTIIGESDRYPVDQVSVELLDPETGHVLGADEDGTDTSGYFSIQHVSPGDYVLRFTHEAHGVTYNGGARSFGTAAPITVPAGADLDTFWALPDGGSITGRATTSAPIEAFGPAAAGLTVGAFVREDPLHPVAFATTSSDGTFRLEPLAAGDYVLAFVDGEGPNGVRGFAPTTLGTPRVVDFVNATATTLVAPTIDVGSIALTGADCTPDRFPGGYAAAVVPGADLVGARLAGCTFGIGGDASGADLHGADLLRSSGAYVDFTGTDLSGARLTASAYVNSRFVGTDLSGAEVRGVNFTFMGFWSFFTDATFAGADVSGSLFGSADLSTVTWSNTTCPDGTNSDDAVDGTCLAHLVG